MSIAPREKDLFDVTFDILTTYLGSLSTEEERDIDNKLSKLVAKGFSNECSADLKNIQRLRESNIRRYKNIRNSTLSYFQQVESVYNANLACCERQLQLTAKRLNSQQRIAEGRMTELVFEVLGEYKKSHIRFMRRKEYLKNAGRKKMILSIWSLRWSRFSAVLQNWIVATLLPSRDITMNNQQSQFSRLRNEDVCLTCRLLVPQQDGEEIIAVRRSLKAYIQSSNGPVTRMDKFDCLSIVKLSKTNLQSRIQTENDHFGIQKEALSIFIAKNSAELVALQGLLLKWSKRHLLSAVKASSDTKVSLPTRPRSQSALQDAYNIRNKEALKHMLTSRYISWLHPSSYHPTLWDNMNSLIFGSSSTANNISPREKKSAMRDDFVRRYYSQHTSTLYNDHIYVCLEERILAMSVRVGGREQKAYATSSSETFDDGDHVLALLIALEDIYVEFGRFFVTNIPTEKNLESIRKVLFSTPLEYVVALDSHRTMAGKNGKIKNASVRALLQTFPDVIRMRSSSCGSLFHFVPAMVINLVETAFFAEYVRQCKVTALALVAERSSLEDGNGQNIRSSKERRSINIEDTISMQLLEPLSRSCPHPNIKYFVSSDNTSSKQAQQIHLFSLVLVQPIAVNSILRDMSDHPSNTISSAEGSPPKIASMPSRQHVPLLTVVPLSRECMRELLRTHLLSNIPSFKAEMVGITEPLSSASESSLERALRRKFIELVTNSPFDILPDHSRERSCGKDEDGSTGGRVDSASVSSNKLKCMYALILEDNFVLEANNGEDGSSRNSKMQKEAKKNAYLVQFTSPNEKPLRLSSTGSPRASFSSRSEIKSFDNAEGLLPEDEWDRHWKLQQEDEMAFRRILAEEHLSYCHEDNAAESNEKVKSEKKTITPNNAITSNGPDGNTGNKRNWDVAVLSAVCRWRACVRESVEVTQSDGTTTATPDYLCAYHLELKNFLDSRTYGSTGSESAKYLPRKAPVFATSGGNANGAGSGEGLVAPDEAKKDVMTIRAASTLLQELWDGKLRSTMKSFTKKVVRDMGIRNSLKHSSSSQSQVSSPAGGKFGNKVVSLTDDKVESIPAVPSWSKWTDQNLVQRTVDWQKANLLMLNSILNLECAISTEFKEFAEINVLPSAELTAIRKEVKAFKDNQEVFLSRHNADSIPLLKGDQASSASSLECVPADGGDDRTSFVYEDLASILDLEQKLCERKLQLLSARRKEEDEFRAVALKRAARAKALEELAMEQAKDPANFRNQRF